jgi:Protein of unknown function (DUF3313)
MMSILICVRFTGAVVLAGMLVACAASRQATEVEEAGFLGDYYGLLKPGDPDRYEAIRRYIAPDVDAARYDKIIVDPVTVWADPEQVETEGLQLADVQELADYLHAVLRDELGDDFELVSEPQPNTLRVQVALTTAAPSNQTMVVVSNVLPIAVAVTQAREYLTGRPTYQGEARSSTRYWTRKTASCWLLVSTAALAGEPSIRRGRPGPTLKTSACTGHGSCVTDCARSRTAKAARRHRRMLYVPDAGAEATDNGRGLLIALRGRVMRRSLLRESATRGGRWLPVARGGRPTVRRSASS